MNKYYTRACNFYFGSESKKKIKKKQSISLNGNNLISFDKLEIINRKKTKIINIKDIKKLPKNLKIKINKDLKKIKQKKTFKKLTLFFILFGSLAISLRSIILLFFLSMISTLSNEILL